MTTFLLRLCYRRFLGVVWIVFDGFGNLLTELTTNKICIYALNAIVPQIFAANELMLAGVDPNNMRFNRASCFDVGVNCGGVGRIAMEIKIENFV